MTRIRSCTNSAFVKGGSPSTCSDREDSSLEAGSGSRLCAFVVMVWSRSTRGPSGFDSMPKVGNLNILECQLEACTQQAGGVCAAAHPAVATDWQKPALSAARGFPQFPAILRTAIHAPMRLTCGAQAFERTKVRAFTEVTTRRRRARGRRCRHRHIAIRRRPRLRCPSAPPGRVPKTGRGMRGIQERVDIGVAESGVASRWNLEDGQWRSKPASARVRTTASAITR